MQQQIENIALNTNEKTNQLASILDEMKQDFNPSRGHTMVDDRTTNTTSLPFERSRLTPAHGVADRSQLESARRRQTISAISTVAASPVQNCQTCE